MYKTELGYRSNRNQRHTLLEHKCAYVCGVVGVCEVDVCGLCACVLRLVRANILLYTYDHSFYELEFDMLTYFSTVADQQRT